jgi:hypothetical protein
MNAAICMILSTPGVETRRRRHFAVRGNATTPSSQAKFHRLILSFLKVLTKFCFQPQDSHSLKIFRAQNRVSSLQLTQQKRPIGGARQDYPIVSGLLGRFQLQRLTDGI